MINLTTWQGDLTYFSEFPGGLAAFLAQYKLDGVELIRSDKQPIPFWVKEKLLGWHLPFWPSWLSFYERDRAALKQDFPDAASLRYYFGKNDPSCLIAALQEELLLANELGAKYAVAHVAHNRLSETFSQHFAADSRQVVDGFICLMNEVLTDLPVTIPVVFENLWWPGMTFLEPELVGRLLTEIHYPHLGLVFDCSHLMITEPSLSCQAEGVQYMLKVLENLGPLSKYIKVVHLNSSFPFSGQKLLRQRKTPLSPPPENLKEFKDLLVELSDYVCQIDPHFPFGDEGIKELLQKINPEYLVHELLREDKKLLEDYLKEQTRCIGSSLGKESHTILSEQHGMTC